MELECEDNMLVDPVHSFSERFTFVHIYPFVFDPLRDFSIPFRSLSYLSLPSVLIILGCCAPFRLPWVAILDVIFRDAHEHTCTHRSFYVSSQVYDYSIFCMIVSSQHNSFRINGAAVIRACWNILIRLDIGLLPDYVILSLFYPRLRYGLFTHRIFIPLLIF